MRPIRFSRGGARLLLAALACAAIDAAASDDATSNSTPAAIPAPSDSGFSYSGFATLAAGRTFGACRPASGLVAQYSQRCTRYIADWAHAGVYTPHLSFSPESRAGIQLSDQMTSELSGTVQVTARSLADQHLNLEWAYLSYRLAPGWTVELGRKRLPLYYYSDFQDVGYAYSTVRPPPDVYGWDIVNYDGASLSYSTEALGWSVRSDVYAGAEHSRDNPYARLFSTHPQKVEWNDILGSAVEFSRDWFTGRLSYTAIKYRATDAVNGPVELYNGSTAAAQHFLGAAVNVDLGAWAIRSEVGEALRQTSGYKSWFYSVSAGYRFGRITPTLGWSTYRESTPYTASYTPNGNTTLTAALRLEVQKSAALKLQFNQMHDKTDPSTIGSAKVLSASYDVVF